MTDQKRADLSEVKEALVGMKTEAIGEFGIATDIYLTAKTVEDISDRLKVRDLKIVHAE